MKDPAKDSKPALETQDQNPEEKVEAVEPAAEAKPEVVEKIEEKPVLEDKLVEGENKKRPVDEITCSQKKQEESVSA